MKSARIRIIETGVKLSPGDEQKLIEAMRAFADDVVELCADSAVDWDQSDITIDRESILKVKEDIV
jgi:hypothetical protein